MSKFADVIVEQTVPSKFDQTPVIHHHHHKHQQYWTQVKENLDSVISSSCEEECLKVEDIFNSDITNTFENPMKTGVKIPTVEIKQPSAELKKRFRFANVVEDVMKRKKNYKK